MTEPYAIWLYGSYARGDHDATSDVDVLLVGQEPPGLLDTLGNFPSGKLSFSRYTWGEIDTMISYGSLFMLHLHLEGRQILEEAVDSPSLSRRLDALGPYAFAERDLRSFRATVDDVHQSLSSDFSPIFELAVIATVLRHASVLGCYLTGQPTFGRSKPIRIFGRKIGLDHEEISNVVDLYRYRMSTARGLPPPPSPDPAILGEWVRFTERFLDRLEVTIDAAVRTGSAAAS
jgi:hypothetical protein